LGPLAFSSPQKNLFERPRTNRHRALSFLPAPYYRPSGDRAALRNEIGDFLLLRLRTPGPGSGAMLDL